MKANATAIAITALVSGSFGCVQFKTLPRTDQDLGLSGSNPQPNNTQTTSGTITQNDIVPSGDSTAAATLTHYGDSFASDFLAQTEMNGGMSADLASLLSADFLSWMLSAGKQKADATTTFTRFSSFGASSAVTGKNYWSLASRLSNGTPVPTKSFTGPHVLAQNFADGTLAMGAPATKVVIVQLGTDDFCSGTTTDTFATTFASALSRIANTHPHAVIVVLPVFNLEQAIETPDSHKVTGFAGRQPTCGEMRKFFASCPALSSENPRSTKDISLFDAAMAQSTRALAQMGRRAEFITWNTKGTLAIDCTHPSAAMQQQMAESAWPTVQKLTSSF